MWHIQVEIESDKHKISKYNKMIQRGKVSEYTIIIVLVFSYDEGATRYAAPTEIQQPRVAVVVVVSQPENNA